MTDDHWAGDNAPEEVTRPDGLAEPAEPSRESAADQHADAAPMVPAAGEASSIRFPDIADLSYESARDQLVGVVQRLESGQAPLDETMSLWERGEALADHCSAWLDQAEKRLDEAIARRGSGR